MEPKFIEDKIKEQIVRGTSIYLSFKDKDFHLALIALADGLRDGTLAIIKANKTTEA